MSHLTPVSILFAVFGSTENRNLIRTDTQVLALSNAGEGSERYPTVHDLPDSRLIHHSVTDKRLSETHPSFRLAVTHFRGEDGSPPSSVRSELQSTALVLSLEFSHGYAPSKVRYAAVIALQFAGNSASHTGASSVADKYARHAVEHWCASSGHLRLHLRFFTDAVIEALEKRSQNSRVKVAAILKQHAPIREAANRAIAAIVSTCETCAASSDPTGDSRTEVLFTSCKGSPCNSASLIAARTSLLGAAGPPQTTFPYELSKFEKEAQAAFAGRRTQAVLLLYAVYPKLLSAFLTGVFAVSSPDSSVSPFAFGVKGTVAGIDLNDLSLPGAVEDEDQEEAEAQVIAFLERAATTAVEGSQRQPGFSTDVTGPEELQRAPRTRIVLCCDDVPIGGALVTLAATHLCPDAASSLLHRSLWNPECWLEHGRPPDSGGAGGDGEEDTDGGFDDPRECLVSSPAVYPTFCTATRSLRKDAAGNHRPGCLPMSPVLWLRQPHLLPETLELLATTADYDQILLVQVPSSTQSADVAASQATTPRDTVAGGRNRGTVAPLEAASEPTVELVCVRSPPEPVDHGDLKSACGISPKCVSLQRPHRWLRSRHTVVASAVVRSRVSEVLGFGTVRLRPVVDDGAIGTAVGVEADQLHSAEERRSAASYTDIPGTIDLIRFTGWVRATAFREALVRVCALFDPAEDTTDSDSQARRDDGGSEVAVGVSLPLPTEQLTAAVRRCHLANGGPAPATDAPSASWGTLARRLVRVYTEGDALSAACLLNRGELYAAFTAIECLVGGS